MFVSVRLNRTFNSKMLSKIHFVDVDIERSTRGQSDNGQWFRERAKRLTASRFYDIIHATKTVRISKIFNDNVPKNIAACRFGLDSEIPAFNLYKEKYNVHIAYYFQPGLCVSHIYPNLAATPDFIVYSDPKFSPGRSVIPRFPEHAYIVEVKSFMENAQAADIYELARLRGKYFCCDVTGKGRLRIRREHKFYYQIIGQLNILFCENPKAYCHLILYYKGKIHVIEIWNDVKLWRSIAPRLCEIAMRM